MNLKIAARNFALSDALQEFANKKLQKLERFSHHIIKGELVMEKDKSLSIVELNLSVKNSVIISKVKTPDIYEGIHDVFQKVERQLKKYEDKFRGRKRVMQKSKRQ